MSRPSRAISEGFRLPLCDPAPHALYKGQYHEKGVRTHAHFELRRHVLLIGRQVSQREPFAGLDLVARERRELGVSRDVADDVEARYLLVDRRLDVVVLVYQLAYVEARFFEYLWIVT